MGNTFFVTDFPILFLCSFSAFKYGAISMLWSHLLYITTIRAPPLCQHFFDRDLFYHLHVCLPIVLSHMSFWHKQNNLFSLNQTKTELQEQSPHNFTNVQRENLVLELLDCKRYVGSYRNINHALDTRAAWKMVYVSVFLFDHLTQNQQWNPTKQKWNFILFRNVPFQSKALKEKRKRNRAIFLECGVGRGFSLYFFLFSRNTGVVQDWGWTPLLWARQSWLQEFHLMPIHKLQVTDLGIENKQDDKQLNTNRNIFLLPSPGSVSV